MRKPFTTDDTKEPQAEARSTRPEPDNEAAAPATEAPKAPVAIKKGDRVRLLQPMFDGTQVRPTDTVFEWPFDDAPPANLAELAPPETPPSTDQ